MISRRMMLGSVAAGILAKGRQARAVASPTLVELFTSQGCSSCPPADRVLAKLAPQSDIVALAFHVDYWDYIGWKDPFAARDFTQRQRDYARAFNNRSVYTPQMVFNGTVELPAQSEAAAHDAITRVQRHAPAAGLNIARRDANIARRDTSTIDIAADLPGIFQGELWAAAYLPAVTTAVRRGENAGRTLTDVNIVRVLANLGRLGPGLSARRWTVPPLDQIADPAALGIAVWVQTPGLGPVLAAAQIGPQLK